MKIGNSLDKVQEVTRGELPSDEQQAEAEKTGRDFEKFEI